MILTVFTLFVFSYQTVSQLKYEIPIMGASQGYVRVGYEVGYRSRVLRTHFRVRGTLNNLKRLR